MAFQMNGILKISRAALHELVWSKPMFAFFNKPIGGLPIGTKTGIILVSIWIFTGVTGIAYSRYVNKK